jgi:hypothetical protein
MPPRRKRAARLRRCRGLLVRVHSTTVASTSSTGPGQSRPPAVQAGRGRSRPASARSSRARSRACARASRTRASAASSTASSIRHVVAVDATGPDTVGWSRSTRQVTDRFAAVGEHRRQIGEHPSRVVTRTAHPQPASASDTAAGSPAASATSASSRTRACDTTPSPSVVAVIFGRVVVACTNGVASPTRWSGTFSTSTIPSRTTHFRAFNARVTPP